MPKLKCTVQTCAHNSQMLCALDAITVGGESAKDARETCCDSFQQRREGSMSNVNQSASDRSEIDCKACECKYNDQCKCEAGAISVEGSTAKQAEGTECATFECGCHS
ncbi:MAG: DUF1540 domain-containing protein [Hespellia sp.]|nr:DUF1540 domain-containing protein [Hespellia sp.]